MAAINVLIADDHGLFREGLRLILEREPDLFVAGEARDVASAVEMAEELGPDVVLVSLGSVEQTAAATRSIVGRLPGCRVLALALCGDEDALARMLEAGASGCGLKSWSSADLTSAIRAVHRGAVYLDPTALTSLLEAHARGHAPRRNGGDSEPLSDREREVVSLLAQGHTNREVADELCLSVNTVHTHRAHVMEKLALRNRADLIRYAIRRGFVGA